MKTPEEKAKTRKAAEECLQIAGGLFLVVAGGIFPAASPILTGAGIGMIGSVLTGEHPSKGLITGALGGVTTDILDSQSNNRTS